jgi:hypothetical protein
MNSEEPGIPAGQLFSSQAAENNGAVGHAGHERHSRISI